MALARFLSLSTRLAIGAGLAIGFGSAAGCASEEAPAPPAPPKAPVSKRTIELTPKVSGVEVDSTVAELLTAEARATLPEARLPIMVPSGARSDHRALTESAELVSRPSFAVVFARGEGITVSIHATRVAHRRPQIGVVQGPDRVRDTDAFITENEAIWSIAWDEMGVSYSAELECANPDDTRCSDDGYLRDLVEALVYVGGGQR